MGSAHGVCFSGSSFTRSCTTASRSTVSQAEGGCICIFYDISQCMPNSADSGQYVKATAMAPLPWCYVEEKQINYLFIIQFIISNGNVMALTAFLLRGSVFSYLMAYTGFEKANLKTLIKTTS